MFNSNVTKQSYLCDRCRKQQQQLRPINNPGTPPMNEVEFYPRAFARPRCPVRCGYPLYTGIRR